MKILIISPQVPLPLTEGGKRSIFGLMKYLSLRGHDIDFISYLKDSDYDSSREELSKFCKPFLLNIKTDNKIAGVLFNLFSPIPYNVSKYHHKELIKFLNKYFRDNVPDLIQIHNVHMAWIIDHLRILTNSPVVLRQENVEMIIMKRFYENQKNPVLKIYSYLQFKKFVRYEPKICEKFDKCVFISSNDERTLKKLNQGIKSINIPSGIENNLLEHAPQPTEKYSLVHIGNLNWLPNRDSLQWFVLNVLPEVVKIFSNARLYVYGGGKFNQIVIPNSVLKNIVYKGFVKDIWKEMENKELLVVPLRIGSGIRIKILEMMAFGINILSTSIGKEGLDIEDSQHILIADSKKLFISKILNFFQGNYNRNQMIKNSRNFIEQKYTWDKIIDQFINVYDNLVKNSN